MSWFAFARPNKETTYLLIYLVCVTLRVTNKFTYLLQYNRILKARGKYSTSNVYLFIQDGACLLFAILCLHFMRRVYILYAACCTRTCRYASCSFCVFSIADVLITDVAAGLL